MGHSIYYIFSTPPLESYYERYGMDFFLTKGWQVHVIDISPIINPDAYKIVSTGIIKDIKREVFYNKKSYKDYSKEISDGAFFVFTTDFIYDTYFVYRSIRESQYYGYMSRMDTNVEPDKVETSERIKGLLNRKFFTHLRNSLFIRIPRKWLPIKASSFFFLGGLANKDEYIRLGYVDNHTKICHIHSMDYEMFLKVKNKNRRLIEEKYCVFLDEYLPYHSDNVTAGYYLDSDKYYHEVNTFLDMMQTKYGIRVVVALHPRANMEICRKKYQGFELRKYETPELIKDCEYVIAHFSTAISYAVLFRKPLIILRTNDIWKNSLWRDVTIKYSCLLNTEVFNASDMNGISMPEGLRFDKDKYNEFIRHYLKADYPSEEEFLGERVYDELLKIAEEKNYGNRG